MNLKTFEKKHLGERCFIVGNGPSLKNTNLDLIKNEYSFAMNRISMIFDFTEWRPSYYSCTTTNIHRPDWKDDIYKIQSLDIPFFIWDRLVKESKDFVQNDNTFLLNCSDGEEVTNNPKEEWWSWDANERVTKFGSSIVVSFQLAVYMGFKEIYLLGTDLNFKETSFQKLLKRLGLKEFSQKFDTNHFNSSYGTPGLPSSVLNSNMLSVHELIDKMTKSCGVKVFNSTIGGNLEIYNRVQLESLY
jgi:hypothetical protein